MNSWKKIIASNKKEYIIYNREYCKHSPQSLFTTHYMYIFDPSDHEHSNQSKCLKANYGLDQTHSEMAMNAPPSGVKKQGLAPGKFVQTRALHVFLTCS